MVNEEQTFIRPLATFSHGENGIGDGLVDNARLNMTRHRGFRIDPQDSSIIRLWWLRNDRWRWNNRIC